MFFPRFPLPPLYRFAVAGYTAPMKTATHISPVAKVLLGLFLAVACALAFTGCEVMDAVQAFIDSFHTKAPEPVLPEEPDDTPLDTDEADIPADYYLVGGFDLSRIRAADDVRQICIVSGHGEHDCHLVFAERTKDGWTCIVDTEGHVGMNGISTNAYEGSVCTPEGVFALGFAFGIKDDPGTRMEYRKVDQYDYWVDDPDSEYYNQWCDSRETGIKWKSAEHLIEFTKPYAYSIWIQHNWPVQGYAQNSAIFLHCIGWVFTGGCVSIPEEDMVTILKAIDPEGAVIVIANGDDVYKY